MSTQCPQCESINVSNHDETYYCYDCEHAWFPDDPPAVTPGPLLFGERFVYLPDGTLDIRDDGQESYTA